MSIIQGLIRREENNTLSFGDYTLDKKTKIEDFEFEGNIYKIKTFQEVTKLKKNELLVYESEPGTVVHEFYKTSDLIKFRLEGLEDSQVTLELEPEQTYEVVIDGNSIGDVKTNLGGKLMMSISLEPEKEATVKIVKKVNA
ncbi:MAG: endosialidase [Velocimicrobium sp.]